MTTEADIDDSTLAGGKTWAEHKVSATDINFTSYSTYLAMSADDQALVASLGAAQLAQGDTSALLSTLTTVDLTDATAVDATTWADLKTEAMAVDYDTSVWTGENLALVVALIEAQTTQGDSAAALTTTSYTTGQDLTDATTLSDGTTTWATLKLSAMDPGYDTSTFSAADQHVFDALVAAQTAQGNDQSLTAVPYDAVTDCTILNTEIDYVPVYTYTITQNRSIYGSSCISATPVSLNQDSEAIFTLELPEELGLTSNTPLEGHYFIECYETGDSTPKYTSAIFAR